MEEKLEQVLTQKQIKEKLEKFKYGELPEEEYLDLIEKHETAVKEIVKKHGSILLV